MEEFPLIVSFYTRDTLYEREAERLRASCERWGLENQIEGIPCFGSWERNCNYKPFFLMQKLQELRRPLFWVDADAVIIKKPAPLKQFKEDFSVRIHADWESSHPSKVMTGGVFVNVTPGATLILKAWGRECIRFLEDTERTQEVWDQIALRDVIDRGVPGARIAPLPQSYCAIQGHPLDEKGIKDPVILHHQASRRFKKSLPF
jgi:hypothetical protein